MKRGLFVGRFQPFHLGHLHALSQVIEGVDELVIVIGSTQRSHEPEDPFTVGERVLMVRRALTETGLSPEKYLIIPVPDAEMHSTWVAQVVSYTPPFDIAYTNESLTRRLFLEAGFKVKGVPLYRRRLYWATEVRRRIMSGGDWEELVPKTVAEVIRQVDGVKRIKELVRTDF